MNEPIGSGHRASPAVPWPGEPVRLIDGTSLFVRHAGVDGATPVVLVHGLGGSSQNWFGLMDELHDAAELWVPDLPGFGESPPARRHTVDAYVAVLIDYVESLSVPAHIVANSMGGLISVLSAAKRPDLVTTLSLVSPAMPNLRLPQAARAMAVLAVPGVGERLLARVNSLPPEEQVHRLASVLFGDLDAVDPTGFDLVVAERARRMEQGYGDAILLESLRSIVQHYTLPPWRSDWRDAEALTCPTLVLLGGRDSLVGSSTAAKWRRTVPHATVVTLPTTGHVAMMEHPAVVASYIREHIGVGDRRR